MKLPSVGFNEALAVSKLEHPNTVRIYDFGETEDKILTSRWNSS